MFQKLVQKKLVPLQLKRLALSSLCTTILDLIEQPVPGILAASHLLQDDYKLFKKSGEGAEVPIHAVFWNAADDILKDVCTN